MITFNDIGDIVAYFLNEGKYYTLEFMIPENTTKKQGIIILSFVIFLFVIFGLYVKAFIQEEQELRGNLTIEERTIYVCSREENPNYVPKWLNLRCAIWKILRD